MAVAETKYLIYQAYFSNIKSCNIGNRKTLKSVEKLRKTLNIWWVEQ